MLNTDFIKERLSTLRIWLSGYLAGLFGVLGWLFVNLDKIAFWRILIAVVAGAWLFKKLIFTSKEIEIFLNQLKDRK